MDILKMIPWGKKVKPFQTPDGKPYHFSFHDQPLDHTVVLGPIGGGTSFLTADMVRDLNREVVFVDVKGDPLLGSWRAFKLDARVYRRDLPEAEARKRVEDALRLWKISRGAARRKARRLARHHQH
jgi:hypothetical protein